MGSDCGRCARVALDMLSERASEGLNVHPVLADLEAGEFVIEPGSWDLIVDCNYLQRSLFPSIRDGVKAGGLFVGVFPMTGINPAYQMHPGEAGTSSAIGRCCTAWKATRAEIVAEKP